MKPYYEQDGIVIYHGDCREILSGLDVVDLVLTDPPYGIASIYRGGASHGWGRAPGHGDEPPSGWDAVAPPAELMEEVRYCGREVVVWGGNYFALPPSRGWFVWNKPERGFSMSEAELAWTSREAVIRVFDCVRSDVGRQHPTQKPLSLMRWCLNQFPDAMTVLDPFMGSGTTLVAAKQLGRRAIGIEIEEKYCEIAAKRLAQGVLPLEASA